MNQRPRLLDRLWALFPASWMLPVLVGLGFLAVGTAVTVVAASQIWHNVHETREEAFEQEVDEVSHDVSDQIDDAAAILAGLDGLFASGEVGRAEFNNYVGKLESTPGFDAMRATSYIRLVTRDEVSRFEAKVRSDTSLRDSGYPDFAVHPDGENDDLFVVDYVEPLETETILGFDIGSNPSRRETVERARDTGELVATPGITLEGAGETGILLMQAIYDGDGVPVGTDERKERFVGVVTGVFTIDELLAAANQPPRGQSTTRSLPRPSSSPPGRLRPPKRGDSLRNGPCRSPIVAGSSPPSKHKPVSATRCLAFCLGSFLFLDWPPARQSGWQATH